MTKLFQEGLYIVLLYPTSFHNLLLEKIHPSQNIFPICRAYFSSACYQFFICQFTDRMDDLMKEAYPITRLKARRINNALSQAQLAAESGVALRQIQLFEQKQRDINNAAAITLFRLSKALHCRMEDLIELF